MINTNSLLKELAIIIGEMDEESRNEILKKLKEKNEVYSENFELLMTYFTKVKERRK
jgi:hypothetical protein